MSVAGEAAPLEVGGAAPAQGDLEGAATVLARWLRVKPYMPAQLAKATGVPLHTMLRAIRGRAPLEDRAALALAGLLGVPFEEIFEVRTYRNGRRECSGWFARLVGERQGAA